MNFLTYVMENSEQILALLIEHVNLTILSVSLAILIVDILKDVNEKNLSSLPVIDSNGILKRLITKTSLVTTLSQQFETDLKK